MPAARADAEIFLLNLTRHNQSLFLIGKYKSKDSLIIRMIKELKYLLFRNNRILILFDLKSFDIRLKGQKALLIMRFFDE